MSSALPELTEAAPRRGRPRVAFVVTSLHGGGAEAVGIAWMTWFIDAGHDVSAIMVSDKPVSELVPSSVTVHRLGTLRGHGAKVSALRRLFRAEAYDAAVALQTYPNLLAIAARGRSQSGPTLVVTEHNLISLGLAGSSPSHRAKVWLAKRWYRRADAVTSASHPVGAEMAAAFGVPPSRSLVVPNPALAKVTDRTPVARVPGTEAGVQLVLACRLVPQKSPHLALHTARALAARGIRTEVVSFGGGPLQDELVALADRLGVPFTPHGWVEDWFEHFAENSVVILPSHREGLGNVLVEAAARGVPSVAVSTALGVADAIIPGVTGELALDDDPESIADAVERAAWLDVSGVDDWLERFSADSSGSLLQQTIDYAHLIRAAR
ncbi:MAG TPA: glycosyltransferase [Microbacterium sp.]|uniref:glycosyltransferase n=1 Tax=Microbacterium sp. TaxID=51671 RepID=UPI002CF5CD0E|nr:glycosyltransferase [Microbacterium sp.]HWI31650.1 glycosyltransferase [Microbacterium sp.]